MAGAPAGNQNAARGKRVRESILRALSRAGATVDGGLDKAADRLVAMLMPGSPTEDFKWAYEQVSNRIDGKPATIIVGDDEQPPVRFVRIERVIVKPADTDG